MLWWKNEQPADYARIAKFVTPAGYVAGSMAGLSGDQAFMDYTFIHFSGFSDARAGTWSQDLCDLLGMDIEKLPQIVEPWRVIGEVSEQAARDFGLATGTPIAAGCQIPLPTALGSAAGMLFDVAGTASVFAGCTDQFVADEKQRFPPNHAIGHPGCGTRWPTSPGEASPWAGSATSSTTPSVASRFRLRTTCTNR
jgi:xylulokinase